MCITENEKRCIMPDVCVVRARDFCQTMIIKAVAGQGVVIDSGMVPEGTSADKRQAAGCVGGCELTGVAGV